MEEQSSVAYRPCDSLKEPSLSPSLLYFLHVQSRKTNSIHLRESSEITHVTVYAQDLLYGQALIEYTVKIIATVVFIVPLLSRSKANRWHRSVYSPSPWCYVL